MHTGGCLCGALRYAADSDPVDTGYCHCRLCQKSTGAPLLAWASFAVEDFRYTAGQPTVYPSSDWGQREFCAACGTHLTTLSPNLPTGVYVKVGTMDDPALFGVPEIAIQTAEARAFHHVPDGAKAFERWVK